MTKTKLSAPSQSGFTLIELLLAMGFLASILIFATLTLVQSLAIYNKGLSFKQINQIGRQLTDDISQVANGGFGSVSTASTDKSGFICIKSGNTTRGYFWDAPNAQQGQGIYTVNSKPIGIIRTNPGYDASENWCASPSSSDTDIASNKITTIATDQVGVVASTVASPDQNLNPGLTRLTFVLGTINPNSDMNPALVNGTWQCPGSNLGNFCAVGTFETTLYSPNVAQ